MASISCLDQLCRSIDKMLKHQPETFGLMTQAGEILCSTLHSCELPTDPCSAHDKCCMDCSCHMLRPSGVWNPHHCAALALLCSGHRHTDGAAIDDVARHLCQRPIALRFISKAHEAIALGAPCEGICDHLRSGIRQISKAWASPETSEVLPQTMEVISVYGAILEKTHHSTFCIFPQRGEASH